MSVMMNVYLNRYIYKSDNFKIISVIPEDKNSPTGFMSDSIVIKGNIMDMKENIKYSMTATETMDKKYGKQYNVSLLVPSKDVGAKDLAEIFKTVMSKSLCNKMVEMYPDDYRDILESKDYERMMKIKGIKRATATKVFNKYEEYSSVVKLIEFIGAGAIGSLTAQKILKNYGNDVNKAIMSITENPYELMFKIDGIGFETADSIAMKVGIPYLSVQRLNALVVVVLREQASENGHTYITKEQLFSSVIEKCSRHDTDRNELKENMETALKELQEDGKIVFTDNGSRCCLASYLYKETMISYCIQRMMCHKHDDTDTSESVSDTIAGIEKEKGITYTDEQRNAISTFLSTNAMILVGGAGTGKTTTLMGMIASIPKGKRYALCSLAGKAAARMSEVTGVPSFTIHRLLGFKDGKFVHNLEYKLNLDIVFIDEVSMVDINLFYSLVTALPEHCKLVLIGDEGQLESIGVGNLFKDILDCNLVPTLRLTKIHRQAQKSAIITDSNKVRNGEQLVEKGYQGIQLHGELKDFLLCCQDDAQSVLAIAFNLFKKKYDLLKDIKKVQIVTPMKKRGKICTTTLNLMCQQYCNPSSNDKREIKIKDTVFREGDRVINRKNVYECTPYVDYSLTTDLDEILDSFDEKKETIDVFNGYQGIIKEIDTERKQVLIDFDLCGKTWFNTEQMANVDLGYACTVHSYQGSQCENIIFVFDKASYMLARKELVYTGITRASEFCALCTQSDILRIAVSTSKVSLKQTYLKEYLDRPYSDDRYRTMYANAEYQYNRYSG